MLQDLKVNNKTLKDEIYFHASYGKCCTILSKSIFSTFTIQQDLETKYSIGTHYLKALNFKIKEKNNGNNKFNICWDCDSSSSSE